MPLREGGVHERRPAVGAPRSPLPPTVARRRTAAVRPEHRDLLAGGARDSTDERVVVRCPLREARAVPRRPEPRGCTSRVDPDLPRPAPTPPAIDDERLRAAAGAVRDAVG